MGLGARRNPSSITPDRFGSGTENIEEKLGVLGARIRRLPN